jgi:hypothetical protein
MKGYCIGKSIVLSHIRYVNSEGRRNGMMFHSETVRVNGKYKTLGCNNMDSSGFCSGHEMSLEEFVERYCEIEDSLVHSMRLTRG